MGESRKRVEQPAICCNRGEDHARQCAQPEAQVVGLHGLRCEFDTVGERAVRVHIDLGWLRLRRQHLHGRRGVETEPDGGHGDYSGVSGMPILCRHTPVVADNLLLLGIYNPGYVVALNRFTGAFVWSSLLDSHPFAVVTMSGTVFQG